MYAIANTTVSILRGTTSDSFGNIIDAPVAVYTGIIAFISSQTLGLLRPVILGTEVFEPASPVPSTTRLSACTLPSGTDIKNTDQVLDEKTGVLYQVYEVNTLGNAGAVLDLVVILKRVTTTEPV